MSITNAWLKARPIFVEKWQDFKKRGGEQRSL